MHSMCIRKMMFANELLLIITDETTFISCLPSGSYDQNFVDQTEEIENDC